MEAFILEFFHAFRTNPFYRTKVLTTNYAAYEIPRLLISPYPRPGMKQARKHVRDALDFNNIETRAVIKLFSEHGKAPKEIHAILTETLACFLPGQVKDLSETL